MGIWPLSSHEMCLPLCRFDRFILLAIASNCFTMMLDDPLQLDRDSEQKRTFYFIGVVFQVRPRPRLASQGWPGSRLRHSDIVFLLQLL